MPSWKPADNYDPEAFYTEASDKKGRGEPIQARIPPQVSGAIAALVQSGKIPQYQTQSDFVRNALVHQLHKDSERTKDEALRKIVTMVTLLNNAIRAARERDDYKTLMDLIQERYTELASSGKVEEASMYIKARLAEIDALPDRFQEDYEKRLSQRLYPI